MTLKEMRQTRRAGLLNVKEKGMTICYIMNRCLVMFLRGEKVNVVQYWWNLVKLKVNKWSFSNGSATKNQNINDVPGQLFCRHSKATFLLDTGSLYWWWKKNSICYRYWQWIYWMSNTKEKAPINWHFTCQFILIYKNF